MLIDICFVIALELIGDMVMHPQTRFGNHCMRQLHLQVHN